MYVFHDLISFSSPWNLGRRWQYPHFMKKEIEALTGELIATSHLAVHVQVCLHIYALRELIHLHKFIYIQQHT